MLMRAFEACHILLLTGAYLLIAVPRVKYLSPAEQEAVAPAFVRMLPWNHFGRKNVGFLYAIQQGAQRVWDFDDVRVGGHLGRRCKRHSALPLQDNDIAKGLTLDVPVAAVELASPADCPSKAFNPYPAMGAPKPNW